VADNFICCRTGNNTIYIALFHLLAQMVRVINSFHGIIIPIDRSIEGNDSRRIFRAKQINPPFLHRIRPFRDSASLCIFRWLAFISCVSEGLISPGGILFLFGV